jgi:peptidoglycan L-alanyl-D-glutamate endopeptidase CwlK
MAANMNDLIPEFRQKAEALLEKCAQRGVEMRPYCTLRSPFEQAKLWRQSRTWEEVQTKIAELKAAGANFLVFCFERVGPQNGRHVTNALPGFSWHQWGGSHGLLLGR